MRTDIFTAGGQYFDFLQPDTCVFGLHEVAHALSNICRFTGHVRTFYSVAQHSVLVSHLVPSEHALAGLLHDAAEAFIGDVSRPLKELLPDYKVIEKRVEAVVFARFGLPAELPPEVTHADIRLLATERRDLMPKHASAWEVLRGHPPLDTVIRPLEPKAAYNAFRLRFVQITGRWV